MFCSSQGTAAPGVAYTCALAPTLTGYTTGMVLNWKPDLNSAGGAITLNVDLLGPVPIFSPMALPRRAIQISPRARCISFGIRATLSVSCQRSVAHRDPQGRQARRDHRTIGASRSSRTRGSDRCPRGERRVHNIAGNGLVILRQLARNVHRIRRADFHSGRAHKRVHDRHSKQHQPATDDQCGYQWRNPERTNLKRNNSGLRHSGEWMPDRCDQGKRHNLMGHERTQCTGPDGRHGATRRGRASRCNRARQARQDRQAQRGRPVGAQAQPHWSTVPLSGCVTHSLRCLCRCGNGFGNGSRNHRRHPR